jgi:sugar lactone lactonase YvrE
MALEIACILDAKAETGEGPVWDERAQVLWWVDIPPGRLHRFDPAIGEDVSFEMGEPIGCLAIREPVGLIVALKSGFYTFDPASGAKAQIGDPEPDRPENRFNDGTTDRQGRFWAGTMPMDGAAPSGRFYRLDPDRSWHASFDGFHTTNGLAFSPDGRTMYFADTAVGVQTVWRADYDPRSGTPSNRQVFVTTHGLAGRPDGGTVDAEGFYWMAAVGGWQLLRFAPDGTLDRALDLPVERPSKPVFGGPDLDVLYLTTITRKITPGTEDRQPLRGGLFQITGLGVRGLPEARFPG